MRTTCILTDSSAQFPNHSFPGQNLVRIIPFDIEFRGKIYSEGRDFKASDLPNQLKFEDKPRLIAPSVQQFIKWYQLLVHEFDQIIFLSQSDHLSSTFVNAEEAVQSTKLSQPILVINSRTISAGLGLLAQIAAEQSEKGKTLSDIEHIIRHQVEHIYTIFCTPGLTYLSSAGIIDEAQALVGEFLSLLPVFTLEEERITPLEKVRNYRTAVELFAEFIEEFENLKHIALIQSSPSPVPDTRSLKLLFQERYPKSTYSEHNLNPPLAITFGPRFLGLIAVEKVD